MRIAVELAEFPVAVIELMFSNWPELSEIAPVRPISTQPALDLHSGKFGGIRVIAHRASRRTAGIQSPYSWANDRNEGGLPPFRGGGT
ncbi:MAG: hypothetical protein KGK00_13155 [Paracoccaceae bacterium]|nr:hypothetical protein [Paracoccaceae bacterium]